MKSKFKNLKDSLGDLESDKSDFLQRNKPKPETSKTGNLTSYVLLAAFLITFGFYVTSSFNLGSLNPFPSISQVINQPDEDLLNRMNALMAEMGYTELTNEELTELRNNGVTATYVASVRELGFPDLTLEDAVRLAQADASATFIAMMQELGYDLTVDEFIRLRRNNVTAFYTSNLHDLGYTDLSTDELIRLRQIGVTPELITQLREEQGEDITLEEIIRYRISNQ